MVHEKREELIERVLTVWGVAVIVWSFYRSNIAGPLWFSEFIAKPIIFLLPIMVFIFRFVPEKGFWGGIGLRARNGTKEVVLDVSVFIVLMIIGAYTLAGPRLLNMMKDVQWGYIGGLTLVALSTAISEEIMGRGFLFRYLLEYSRNLLLSGVLSSILFFILFLPGILTTSLSGEILLMSLVLNLTISFIAILLYSLRGSLYMSIAVHTAILLWFDILLNAGR